MAAKISIKRLGAIATLLTLLAMMIMCFVGCKVIQPTLHTSETKVTTINTRDTTFIYKGGEVGNGTDLDSILKYLTSQEAFKQHSNGIQPKVIYTDAQNKVALTFWLDKYGKLQANCTSKDSSWQARLTDIQSSYEKKLEEKKIIKERYTPIRIWVLIGCMLPFTFTGLYVIGGLLIKSKFKINK